MPDLTPLEAAEKLEFFATLFPGSAELLNSVASYLRKIASGEYAPVVHAHWAVVNTRKVSKKVACSWCGKAGWNFQNLPRCPYCGALMDGKDDSHETD